MSNDFDIRAIAQLARIKVDSKQEVEINERVTKVLGFVDQVRQADVPDIESKDFFRLTKNRLRPDTNRIEPETYTEKIMRVAPNRQGDYFKVKKIINRNDD